MQIIENYGDQSGYEELSPTSSTGFTSTVIKPTSGSHKDILAEVVVIGVENYPIRFRLDGTAPTATSGILINADNYYAIIGGSNVVNFRCIDTADGASSVKCLFFF